MRTVILIGWLALASLASGCVCCELGPAAPPPADAIHGPAPAEFAAPLPDEAPWPRFHPVPVRDIFRPYPGEAPPQLLLPGKIFYFEAESELGPSAQPVNGDGRPSANQGPLRNSLPVPTDQPSS